MQHISLRSSTAKSLKKNDIILVGDVRIPVSRDRKQMTKEQFMIGRRR